ncbi:MAG: AAA family ATPase, partial [Roseofilum sp. SBFL]|uniref:ATP-binding protein n=2 Tax=Roseofilum TaxID=1233426 RepID=UPI001B0FDC6E
MTRELPGYQINQKIYEGDRTLVYQATRHRDRLKVVIKFLRNPYPSLSELLQFRNQYEIAKNLNPTHIVVPLSLERYGNGYALVMEDEGAISLDKVLDQKEYLELETSLQIGIQLADIVDELERKGVIHKDIKPANLLIDQQSQKVKLIDFSIASPLPREAQDIKNFNVLEGTLAYIAPEQTGRMNRGIDYRSDFYSLGVTLYQLLTGTLPFISDDPMELVHCHISQPPVPPEARNSGSEIPSVVSHIVMKLMAKNAEQRYQSALGLKFDLEQALKQWQETGQIEAFELASRDIAGRFLIPEKLYGRQAEVETLLGVFERVAQSSTTAKSPGNSCSSELMLVAGFSGIGKTAVVNEVHKPIVRERGYFIKGKFDQFQRNIPFSALVRAFRDLMEQLLGESDAQLAQWQQKILGALGENGQVIIEVIPELELIIGQQQTVPELSGGAAQNRFNLLFQKFVGVFATSEHPLVIFIDDLQWADSASLKLMQLLMSESQTGYLLLLGAYRDNEVSSTHPLMLTLDEMGKSGAVINTITLAPLRENDLHSLVADTLSCSQEVAQPLTALIYQKTKGNPFFATQFLKGLHEDELIAFNHDLGYWHCDLTQVQQLVLTDDVVEFMAVRLLQLPVATQEMLKLAACIGNQFDLETLAIVSELDPIKVADSLWKALQEGLILPLGQTYKFFQGSKGEEKTLESDLSVSYKFLHDRVQQAAYSLILEAEKQKTHLKIGQLLLSNTTEEEREEKIFALVNQLNYGVELIVDTDEREQLVRLNLAAGIRAKTATAYSGAVNYFAIGRELLRADCWQTQYDLTLALFESAAEAAYLNGEFEAMEGFIEEVLREGRSLLERVKVYEVKLQAYAVRNQFFEAIETAWTVLKLFGISFPESPTDADIQRAFAETKSQWGDRSIEDLKDLPAMIDPEKMATLRILISITGVVYIAMPQFLPLIVCEQIKLSMNYGNARWSAFSYSIYGTILCGVLGDIEAGYQFGQLASHLLSQFNATEITAKVVINTNGDIRHWKEPIQSTIKPLFFAYETGLETGDIEFAAYCACYGEIYSYLAGTNLIELAEQIAIYSLSFQELKQETVFYWSEINRQAILNLMESGTNPGILVGTAYNEEKYLPLHQESNDRLALHMIHCHKLILNYLFDRLESAIENAEIAEKYLDGVTAMFVIPTFYFYDSLARLRGLKAQDTANLEAQLQKVDANQNKMEKWASYAPMNHLHKFNLVEAEKCRVLGKIAEAIVLYDQAISGAEDNNFIQEESLANELAAQFYLDWGKERVAGDYMTDAYYGYARWGAKAKADQLEQQYPQLLSTILQQPYLQFISSQTVTSPATRTVSSTNSTTGSILDWATAIKAAQSLSSEIHLDKLVSILMKSVMENAGADRAILLLNQQDAWRVVAQCTLQQGQLHSISAPEEQALPNRVINKVKRSQQPIIVNDFSHDTEFAAESYLRQDPPLSFLCAPILNQGKLIGILYVENHLAVGAFTGDRVEILSLICSQAAISLENARLY